MFQVSRQRVAVNTLSYPWAGSYFALLIDVFRAKAGFHLHWADSVAWPACETPTPNLPNNNDNNNSDHTKTNDNEIDFIFHYKYFTIIGASLQIYRVFKQSKKTGYFSAQITMQVISYAGIDIVVEGHH